MYLIASFGVTLTGFCVFMVINPQAFSAGIVSFSQKKWFHSFEIISRLMMGVIFLSFSNETKAPNFFDVIGWGLLLVAFGLLLLKSNRHTSFAVWAAHKFQSRFRLIGIISAPFGLLLAYMAIGS